MSSSSRPPLPTQLTLANASSFSELVAWVFMSVYWHGGIDPETKREIDFSDLPLFGSREIDYSTGDNVASWDNDFVLYFERRGDPRVLTHAAWKSR